MREGQAIGALRDQLMAGEPAGDGFDNAAVGG
jgi:hypothetical protein